ncbi:MAG: hypothetical protein ACE5G8_14385 [Anaerolineae bacterium]
MTQNWGPPNYPPRPPQYQQPPQYQLPEPDYGYEGPGDSTGKRALFFLTGSCATLLLVACCVLVLAVGWVVDERFGITTPRQEPAAGALPDEPFVPAPPVQFTAPAPLQPAGQETQPAAPQSLTPPAPQAPPPAEPVVIGQPVSAGDAAI